jgi:zinc-ribbon domain
MAYVCELGTGRKLYLNNDNGQTTITVSSSNLGQQQQTSSSFQTGVWKTIPEVYLTADGAVVKLQTAQHVNYIRVQGGSIGVSEALSLEHLHQMQMQQVSHGTNVANSTLFAMPAMPAMEPMQPATSAPGSSGQAQQAVVEGNPPLKPGEMQMGNMQMTGNSMQMRMGNMEMKLGNPPAIGTMPVTRRFCSQCGAGVKPGDRFCSTCGHGLGEEPS